MKNVITVAILAFLCLNAKAQNFIGVNTSKYAGLYGADDNPANIVSDEVKGEFAFFQVNTNITSRDLIFSTKEAKNKNNFLHGFILEDGASDIAVSARTKLLSFSGNPGKENRSAYAFTIENRASITEDNLDTEVLDLIFKGFNAPTLENQNFAIKNSQLKAYSWNEVAFTYGRKIFDKDKHTLSFAGKFKVMMGGVMAQFDIADASIRLNDNKNISLTSSQFNYEYSNSFDIISGNGDINDVTNELFSSSPTYGFDLGATWEFRPDSTYLSGFADSKYKFKLGLAVTDIGKVAFNKTNYFDIGNVVVDSINVENFSDDLANRVTKSSKETTTVGLPTTLNFYVDYHFTKQLYSNINARIVLAKGRETIQAQSVVSLTFRWELPKVGFYLPISFASTYTGVGLGMRLGPLTLGTNNILGLASNRMDPNANIYVGLRSTIMYKKKERGNSSLTD